MQSIVCCPKCWICWDKLLRTPVSLSRSVICAVACVLACCSLGWVLSCLCCTVSHSCFGSDCCYVYIQFTFVSCQIPVPNFVYRLSASCRLFSRYRYVPHSFSTLTFIYHQFIRIAIRFQAVFIALPYILFNCVLVYRHLGPNYD